MTTVYFIRHVQASGNIDRVFQGQIDTEVSEQGLIQLGDLKERFQDTPLDRIYTSPLKRAKMTSQAVKGDKAIPVIEDNRLKEIAAGIWEGVSLDAIAEQFPDDLKLWQTKLWEFQVEGSESCRQVYDRTGKALGEFLEQSENQTLAVVSHGCSLRNMLCFAMGKKVEELGEVSWLGNASVTKMTFDKRVPGFVHYLNDQSHVTPETILKKPNILK